MRDHDGPLTEAYTDLVRLIMHATSGATIEECLERLIKVGEHLEEHYPEAVRLATHPQQASAIDLAELLGKATLLFH